MAIVSVIALILSLLCAHGSSIAHLPRRLRPVCSKFALTGPLTEPESRQSLVDGTYHNNNSDSTMPASVHLSLKTINISSEDRPGSSQFVSEFYEKNSGTTVLACSGDRLSLEHFCVHISGRNFSDDMQLQYRKVLSSLKLNYQSDSVRSIFDIAGADCSLRHATVRVPEAVGRRAVHDYITKHQRRLEAERSKQARSLSARALGGQ